MHLKIIAVGLFVLAADLAGLIPIHDPWFAILLVWWIFSSVTAGMPEPDLKSSFYYVWAYRTMHLLAASGTSYFSHKKSWPSIEPMDGEDTPCLLRDQQKAREVIAKS